MKRFSKIMTLILVAFVLTGCVRKKVTMKIKKNGDIEVSAIDAYASNAGMSVSDSEKEEYKKNGFKVEDYEADDYKGVKVSKKFKISDVSSDSPVTFSIENLMSTANPKMFQKTGDKTYKATMVLDATSGGSSGSGADISYTVTLPSKPISHNADKVDGNTLTWTLDLGQKKNINYEFSLNGSNNMLWIILGIVGVAAVAIVVVVVLNNKNKGNANGAVNANGVQPIMPNQGVVPSVQPSTPVENMGIPTMPETPVAPAENIVPVESTSMVEPTPIVDNVSAVGMTPVMEETPVVSEMNSVETMPEATVTEVAPTVEETPVVESVENSDASVEEKQPTDMQ